MSSMHLHHLKKLHPMLTSLLLCIRQNHKQKINTNAFFFFISHSLIHLTLYFGHPQNCLPQFLTVAVVLKIANSPTIANGSNKSHPTPTTMARIRSLLLHFHSVTTTWWDRCRSICTHFHHKRNYTHERITNHKIAPPNSLAPQNRMRGAHLLMESKHGSAPQNPTRGAILVSETLNQKFEIPNLNNLNSNSVFTKVM